MTWRSALLGVIIVFIFLQLLRLLVGCSATPDRYTNPQVTEAEWAQLHGPWAPPLTTPYDGPPLEEMLF